MTEKKCQGGENAKTERIPIRRRKLFSSRDLRATTIGMAISQPIVGGPFLGFIFDRRLDTGVRWSFILLGIGLVSAIFAVVKYIRYEFYLINKEKKEEESKGIRKEWRNYDDE